MKRHKRNRLKLQRGRFYVVVLGEKKFMVPMNFRGALEISSRGVTLLA